jgi:hypothetical protein
VRRVPLVVTVAGVACKGWSAEGARKEFADKSERTYSIFVGERMARAERLAEDISFVECTQFYKVDVKRVPAREARDIFIIRWGPEYQGRPHKRPRTFAALLNKATARWMGPTDWQSDFKRRFQRSIATTGELLFLATVEEMWD